MRGVCARRRARRRPVIRNPPTACSEHVGAVREPPVYRDIEAEEWGDFDYLESVL